MLKDALKFFNLTPQIGDVLIVRTGFEDAVIADQARVKNGEDTRLLGKWAGVKASDELIKWIWESGFVAVGSDNPTFEEWCMSPNLAFLHYWYSLDPEPPALILHPILLSGMGIMIGEILRLNALAEECKKLNRWTFFLSSCPLMIEHGVASPPNAVAIL
jgi:kynurenine formamidase